MAPMGDALKMARTIGNRPAWAPAALAAALALGGAACGSPSSAPAANAAKAAPAIPPDYAAAARRVLGEESEVILSGDLAGNGHIQLLVVNRLPKIPKDVIPGLLVSRAAILEND